MEKILICINYTKIYYIEVEKENINNQGNISEKIKE